MHNFKKIILYLGNNQLSPGLCMFLCKLWEDRCPEETETFNLICKDARDENCSRGYSLFLNILKLIFVILLLN